MSIQKTSLCAHVNVYGLTRMPLAVLAAGPLLERAPVIQSHLPEAETKIQNESNPVVTVMETPKKYFSFLDDSDSDDDISDSDNDISDSDDDISDSDDDNFVNVHTKKETEKTKKEEKKEEAKKEEEEKETIETRPSISPKRKREEHMSKYRPCAKRCLLTSNYEAFFPRIFPSEQSTTKYDNPSSSSSSSPIQEKQQKNNQACKRVKHAEDVRYMAQTRGINTDYIDIGGRSVSIYAVMEEFTARVNATVEWKKLLSKGKVDLSQKDAFYKARQFADVHACTAHINSS